ncbi:MAG TPA: sulfatase [Nevskiaceae bacterium]|nr:sulfatase [Nevskiaceae bacterium]
MSLSIREVWRRTAGDIAVLLIFLQLPLVRLFTLRSQSLYMSHEMLVEDTALLVVVYAFVAILIGAAIALLVALVARFSERSARMFLSGVVWFYAALSLIVLGPYVANWIGAALGAARNVGVSLPGLAVDASMALLALLILVAAVRRGLQASANWLSGSLAAGYNAALVLTLGCLVLVVVTGHAAIRPFGWKGSDGARSAAPGSPDVILISIDTLAAKDMSLYGYALPTTPRLEAFARQASVFDNFFANSNWTTPTITTLLTGLYPPTHGAVHMNGRLPAPVPTIASLLREHGYVTAAVVSNSRAHPLEVGFGDGFDYVSDVRSRDAGPIEDSVLMLERAHLSVFVDSLAKPLKSVLRKQRNDNWFPQEMVSDPAMGVVQSGRRPLFLWTHFTSPHQPYLPPAPFLHRFLASDEFTTVPDFLNPHFFYRPEQQTAVDHMRLRYDEYVAYTDDGVGSYVQRLDEAGLLDNAIVIITADHGESFEKGWNEHAGPMLHQALIHVPLLIRLPGQQQGRHIQSNAEQADLLPTLLELLHLPIPERADGESLVPALQSQDYRTARAKFSFELGLTANGQRPRAGSVSVIKGAYKLVHRFRSGCEELYALDRDPNELEDLSAADPETASSLRQLIAGRMHMQIDGHSARAAAGECAWSIADWIPAH